MRLVRRVAPVVVSVGSLAGRSKREGRPRSLVCGCADFCSMVFVTCLFSACAAVRASAAWPAARTEEEKAEKGSSRPGQKSIADAVRPTLPTRLRPKRKVPSSGQIVGHHVNHPIRSSFSAPAAAVSTAGTEKYSDTCSR